MIQQNSIILNRRTKEALRRKFERLESTGRAAKLHKDVCQTIGEPQINIQDTVKNYTDNTDSKSIDETITDVDIEQNNDEKIQ